MVCDAVSSPRRRLVLCPVLEVGDIESPLACRCWRNVSRNRSRPRERRRRGWCRWPHALIRGITRSAPANAASTSPGRRPRRRTDRARCLADQPAGPTSCLASSGRTFSRPAEASGAPQTAALAGSARVLARPLHALGSRDSLVMFMRCGARFLPTDVRVLHPYRC